MWYVCDLLYAVLYVCVSCFVVRGCAVSRRYINVCICDMFSVVNVYLDHLKLCVLMVEGMSVVVNVMLSLMSVMSPPPALCNLSARTVVKLCQGVHLSFNANSARLIRWRPWHMAGILYKLRLQALSCPAGFI